jgi:HSP20 family protein
MRELVNMRDNFNRFIEQALDWPVSESSTMSHIPLAIDLYEVDNQVKVSVPLPGIQANEVNAEVTGRQLTISGEHKAKEEVKEDNYYRREVRYGSFNRIIELPDTADTEHPTAEFENGVLTISFPKLAEEARKPTTRKIEVMVKEPAAA